MWAVGVDLGTSNTVAVVRSPDGRTRPVLFDGEPVLPSAVFLDHDGVLRVGRDAQRLAPLDPARFEPNPKRRIDEQALLLGDRELPVVEVLAAPLRETARAVSGIVGHLPPAVVTCPVAWGPVRRQRLRQAAAVAGWPPVRLVPEPVAAARYFTETLRRPVPPGGILAIFDFGGGTLDVALVRNDGPAFTVVGTAGAEDLGGLDLDAAVVTHLGHLLAERHPQAWDQLSHPTGELARALRPANLAPGQLSGVFLVGGTSRVPLLSRLLHTETGIAPTVLEQPELPVAEGAVAQAPVPVVAPAPGPPSPPPVWTAPQPAPQYVRVWPWLLGTMAVIAFICTALYQFFNIGDA